MSKKSSNKIFLLISLRHWKPTGCLSNYKRVAKIDEVPIEPHCKKLTKSARLARSQVEQTLDHEGAEKNDLTQRVQGQQQAHALAAVLREQTQAENT